MREKVLTEQWLVTSAVETVSAQLSIIAYNALARLHSLHSSANTDNLSSKFMTWNQRECGEELALVNVEIRPTDTTGAHLHEHFIRPYLWCWHLPIAELLWGIVDNCFHSISPNLALIQIDNDTASSLVQSNNDTACLASLSSTARRCLRFASVALKEVC